MIVPGGGRGRGGRCRKPRELPNHAFRNLYPPTPSSSVAQTSTQEEGEPIPSLLPDDRAGRREGQGREVPETPRVAQSCVPEPLPPNPLLLRRTNHRRKRRGNGTPSL